MTEYPEVNTYNPIKNSTFTPSVEILSKRKKIAQLKNGRTRVLSYFSRTTMSVYGALTRFLGKEGNKIPNPKIDLIAEVAFCHRETARQAIATLEEEMVIYTKETGRAKKYYFIPLNADGTPNKESGEYQFAKVLRGRKKRDQIPLTTASDTVVNGISYKELDRIPLENIKRELDQPPPEPPKKEPPNPTPKPPNATADCLKKIRSKLPKETNRNIGDYIITKGLNQYGLDYMVWLANKCHDKPNSVAYFCKGVHHREEYNEYDRKIVREGESKATAESERHKDDIANIAVDFDLKTLLKDVNK